MMRLPRFLALATVLLAGCGLDLTGLAAVPAQAATTKPTVITVDDKGFHPATLTIPPGTAVVFHNGSAVLSHRVQSASKNWSYDSGPLTAGSTTAAYTFKATGTFSYADTAPLTSGAAGKVVVAAGSTPPPPSPSPTASPKPAPKPSAAAPKPTAAPKPSPGPSTSPGSGVAVSDLPALATGMLTSPTPRPSGVPAPVLATGPLPGADPGAEGGRAEPSEQPGRPGHGAQALFQPRPIRRLGLPAALAAVLLAGVGFAQLRLLLAEADR